MGTTNIPFASGKNHKFVLLLNDDRVPLAPKSWDIEENATEDEDDVNGEDRSRPQKIVNFYSVNITAYVPDTTLLDKMIEYSNHLDLLVGPQESAIGMMVYPNNGTKALFEGSELTIGAWKYASGERRSRSMITIPIKMRYFKKAR